MNASPTNTFQYSISKSGSSFNTAHFFFFRLRVERKMLRDTGFPCVRGRNKPVQLKWYLRKDIIYRSENMKGNGRRCQN